MAPTTLDPANTIIAGDIYTLDKIFEPLFVTNASGELTPWLATGFKASNGNKTMTFPLRPGVKFSNGNPLTAADVVFSINRSRKNSAGPLSFLDGAITSIGAAGNSVVVHLSAPWAPIISDISVFANSIIPDNFGGKSEIGFLQVADRDRSLHAVIVHPGRHVVDPEGEPALLAIREAVPGIGRVPLRRQRQPARAADRGRTGEHHRHRATRERVGSLKTNSSVVLKQFPAWEVDLLVLNEKLPQFADRHVRRAITYAINRPALVHAANFGTGEPGGSFFPPSLQYYSKATPVLAYSLTKAKAELAQSKYPKGFATKLLVDSGNQKFVTFAQIIKSQLAPLGIDVTITGLDHSAFESTFQKFDYDMFIDYAINDISDPDEMASFELDFKDGGSSSYWSSYDNPAVIALVH